MPLWYQNKEIDFSNNHNFRKFLPNTIDYTVKEIAEEIIESFTKEVQDFIIRQLKVNKIIE